MVLLLSSHVALGCSHDVSGPWLPLAMRKVWTQQVVFRCVRSSGPLLSNRILHRPNKQDSRCTGVSAGNADVGRWLGVNVGTWDCCHAEM